ncbi:MAG: GGDEF domain-containing protein [Thermochromatium sp.]
MDIQIVSLRNARGEVTHFAAIERDITAQKAEESVLRELATTDPLTGVLNRRGFSKQAQGCLAGALRDGQELSLAMIDIDFFKRINDTYSG